MGGSFGNSTGRRSTSSFLNGGRRSNPPPRVNRRRNAPVIHVPDPYKCSPRECGVHIPAHTNRKIKMKRLAKAQAEVTASATNQQHRAQKKLVESANEDQAVAQEKLAESANDGQKVAKDEKLAESENLAPGSAYG